MVVFSSLFLNHIYSKIFWGFIKVKHSAHKYGWNGEIEYNVVVSDSVIMDKKKKIDRKREKKGFT